MIDSAVRVLRAALTNQLARFAPHAYVRLTGQTGRGAAAEERAADIARYFEDCVDDYFVRLGVPANEVAGYLRGKTLLEYGPGDLPGVAALMVARGAEKVYCVDRFPLVRLDEKNTAALHRLIEGAQGSLQRQRLLSCLRNPADPGAGFDPTRIEYLVLPSGLSGLRNAVDLVYSRAVLEHVNDLPATLADMVQALRPGATAVHLVDLRSHGLHRSNPLDFLTWPEPLWRLMYSEKGVPNRLRVDRYRDLLKALPVDVRQLEATRLASPEEVSQVRPQLAAPFRSASDEDLRWLGFWLVMRRQGAGV